MRSDWEALHAHQNRNVRVIGANETIEGIARGVTDGGELILETVCRHSTLQRWRGLSPWRTWILVVRHSTSMSATVGSSGACALTEARRVESSIANIARIRASGRAARPSRIRISSVASQDHARRLAEWLQSHFGVVPEFARTTRFAAGVTCGYEDPTRLGVDRWLSVLAATSAIEGAVHRVSALVPLALWTSLTRDGMHKGGFIVPGLRLMTDALFDGTADVQVSVRSVEQPGAWHQYAGCSASRCRVDARRLRQRIDSTLQCDV